MKPATNSKRQLDDTKLMIIDAEGVRHTRLGRLSGSLRPGDLLVVNSSGTLPSSFRGRIRRSGHLVELRLAAFRGFDASDLGAWAAISFGSGDWRTPTERRGPPPPLEVGDRVDFGPDLAARVVAVDRRFGRLLEIRFESEQLVQSLYRHGRPIQYSYLEEELAVWDQQTLFGGPPLSVEPPSAALSLTWGQLLELRRAGVELATILHSAGISSSGDEALDAVLPLTEYFEVPEAARRRIDDAKRRGSRVIALGTTVARALESAYESYRPDEPDESGESGFRASGTTGLKLRPGSRLRVTDALITGMHAEGTSHAELMKAFCGCDRLAQAEREAEARGYRSHEFGDLALLDCRQTK